MSSGKKQILWVDDEIEFLKAHIMFLEDHNYDVTTSTNGDDALALIKGKQFDLVYLDEQMPGKDGLTTLEEIKAHNASIPVVMVTKSEEEQLMEEALGRNIDGYLIKPVNPSQILSVCKSILHSSTIKKTHITSEYVREYAEYKARLMTSQTPQDWCRLYKSLVGWDVNLKTIKDQGLEETHNNHKAEVSKKFIHYMGDNYLGWMNGRSQNTILATHTFSRKVFPLLKQGKKVCFVVMAGFRLDQWLTIKQFLSQAFKTEESMACALLPTDRLFCRSALLSGRLSRDISQNQPGLWKMISSEGNYHQYEKELLKINFSANGVQDFEDLEISYIKTMEDAKELLDNTEQNSNKRFTAVVVEFSELLMNLRKESMLLQELAPDENGFRELTRIWFQSSSILKYMLALSRLNTHIVLTSDHGSILVKHPIEVFCQEERSPHPRVKIGKNISCDERHTYFIENPASYGLPDLEGVTAYAIAKEDRYFTYPNKYQYFDTKFKDQMVCGGLSMDELLVPLITLTPNAA